MSVRYLRRSVKARAGKKPAVVTRASNALPGGSTGGAIPIAVTP